ncbi:MAG TPA: MFS transporter [Bryobacteraceae bacterium]|nr:MFS transporter [Bryobacteraceae bacterium]
MRLSKNQRLGFLAAWGGWALDGMDSFIYALVLAPALRELLPRSGHAATTANVGYYGSVLFALFLIGWGVSFIWGPLADRFGRVRTLVLTILCYSLFTFTGALATNIWQLAVFRLLAGIGIGGEWTLGGTFVAEEWPEEHRKMGAGLMQTGYYFGILIAAGLNATIGAHYGWRAMFAVGGLPAFLVILIQRSVKEPSRWKPSESALKPFAMIFSRPYRRRTILNSIYLLVSITGLWAGSVYVPTAVIAIANREGAPATEAASLGTAILSIGTIFACVALPVLAEKIGRRATLAVYFAIMFFSISIGFGYLFYLPHALKWFLLDLFILGIGGANFAMYTLWLPEQYPTECRASAFAFATSSGRFLGAGITFLVGAGVAHFGSVGTPVALTSLAFLVGLLLLPFGVETKGQALPE